jgi:hypothetical protein
LAWNDQFGVKNNRARQTLRVLRAAGIGMAFGSSTSVKMSFGSEPPKSGKTVGAPPVACAIGSRVGAAGSKRLALKKLLRRNCCV